MKPNRQNPISKLWYLKHMIRCDVRCYGKHTGVFSKNTNKSKYSNRKTIYFRIYFRIFWQFQFCYFVTYKTVLFSAESASSRLLRWSFEMIWNRNEDQDSKTILRDSFVLTSYLKENLFCNILLSFFKSGFIYSYLKHNWPLHLYS